MKNIPFYVLASLFLIVTSCKQAQDIQAFTEANYKLEGIDHVKINGVNLDKRMQTQRGMTQAERDSLLTSLTTDRLRLSGNLALHVALQETAEDRTLTITRLRWLLQVDGEDALTGIVEKTMVLREGLNTIPVNTPVLLTENDGQPNYTGLSRLINLISQKGDIRQSITFKIKPTVKTPVGNVETPHFITVSKLAGS